MIVELWIILAALALASSMVSIVVWRVPAFFFVAGLLWMVVAWNSGLIEMSVVYTNSDYLREFRFPFLVIFFSLLGLSHLVYFIFQLFGVLEREGREVVEG